MIDATPLADPAESIAEQRQRAKERRTLGAAVLAVLLLSAAPLWLGAVLGLAVRIFTAAAGWGG